jgi:hypothetical protein
MNVIPCILLILAGFAGGAVASSTISTTDRHAYAANAGWIDFRPTAGDGVRVDETFLSGYAYAANFGWIHLGDGSPENGHSYSNNSSSDYGVNLAAMANSLATPTRQTSAGFPSSNNGGSPCRSPRAPPAPDGD